MYMIILGTILLVLKVAQVGPTSEWSWFVVLLPFGVALVWWAWADWSGWTKRRAMEKMEDKKRERRASNLSALGLDPRGGRSSSGQRGFRDAQSEKIEDKRAEIRRKNKATLARSTRPGALEGSGSGASGDSRY